MNKNFISEDEIKKEKQEVPEEFYLDDDDSFLTKMKKIMILSQKILYFLFLQ